jgi:threonine dehydratase
MVGQDEVRRAARGLEGRILRTPLLPAPSLGRRIGCELWLKLENLQEGGSFKLRGATWALLQRLEAARARGVVTGSSGNHGTALALAAGKLGVRAVVVMPEDAVAVKRRRVEEAGARVLLHGRSSEERLRRASELAREEGLLLVPPYDDLDVIAGQGTVGLEAILDLPRLQDLLVPCGGGGLAAGCAAAVAPAGVRVFGAEPELAADTHESLRRGERVRIPVPQSLADGARNVMPGAITFPIVQALAAGVLLASEEAIRDALVALLLEARVLAEPTGAVALAALLAAREQFAGRCVAVVVSGGNVDPGVLRDCLSSA